MGIIIIATNSNAKSSGRIEPEYMMQVAQDHQSVELAQSLSTQIYLADSGGIKFSQIKLVVGMEVAITSRKQFVLLVKSRSGLAR